MMALLTVLVIAVVIIFRDMDSRIKELEQRIKDLERGWRR